MDFKKGDAIIRKVRIGALAGLVFLLLLFAVLCRDSIIPGWHTKGEDRYYVTFPFSRASGLAVIGGEDYIFSDYGSHALLHGWCKYDGVTYYAGEDGRLLKGEVVIDGEGYNLDPNTGELRKNRTEILGGKLWYFNDHGYKTFGIIRLDGFYFCFSEAGNLKKGLQVIDGKTYYFDPADECMVFGLTDVGTDTYYFGEDGAAVTGEVTLNGTAYIFGEDGRQIG